MPSITGYTRKSSRGRGKWDFNQQRATWIERETHTTKNPPGHEYYARVALSSLNSLRQKLALINLIKLQLKTSTVSNFPFFSRQIFAQIRAKWNPFLLISFEFVIHFLSLTVPFFSFFYWLFNFQFNSSNCTTRMIELTNDYNLYSELITFNFFSWKERKRI